MESPVVAAMRDSCVTDDVIKAYVTSSLNTISSQQEGHASHAVHRVLALAQPQTLCAVAAFLVEQETEHCGKTNSSFLKVKPGFRVWIKE